jgi:two-component system sensor histidine kinase UhpB
MATWNRRKAVLMTILVFSIILICFSLYHFASNNQKLELEFEKKIAVVQTPAGIHNGWAYSGTAVAISLIVIVFFLLLREIHLRKRLIELFKIQKEHYRITINSITEGLITTDKDGAIIFMNPAAERLTGWSMSEAKKLPLEKVYRVVNEATGQSFDHVVSRILKKPSVIEFENNTLLKTKDSKDLIVCNSGSPLFDKKGNLTGAVLIFYDITEKKKKENLVAHAQAFSAGILNAVSAQIAVINSSGIIIKTNASWNNFAINNGVTCLAKCGEGVNYFDLCKTAAAAGDEISGKIIEGIQQLMEDKTEEFSVEYPCHSPQQEKWFYMRVKKFESTETLLVTEHHDITERKQAELLSLKAVERYEILSKATSDTIWDWDIANNKMQYNSAIKKIFGFKETEIGDVFSWWKKNIHPDDLQNVTDAYREAIEKSIQKIQLQYRFRTAGGSYKYIYDRGFLIYDSNKCPVRMIGAMQDITHAKEEEKRIAKAIIDAQEQERRYIGQELHDNVNQLLAGSLLSIGMIKQCQCDTTRIFEFTDITRTHIMSALNEIRNLSHQLIPVALENSNLKDNFETLLATVNLSERFKIKLSFDDAVTRKFNEDVQVNLYRILQEQVKNILKYSGAGEIEIAVSDEAGMLRMRIADNGKGFNPKEIKTGVGMCNMKRRAESFGGKFILNTQPGSGCEIIVEIPAGINKPGGL